MHMVIFRKFSEKQNIESFNQLTNEEDEVTREQLYLKYQQLVSQLNNYDDLKIKESELMERLIF